MLRHPNKRNPQLAQQYLSEKVWDGESDTEARAEFSITHNAWCDSEGWTWKQGARCPTFAEFICDYELSYRGQKPPGGEGKRGGLDYGSAEERARVCEESARIAEREQQYHEQQVKESGQKAGDA